MRRTVDQRCRYCGRVLDTDAPGHRRHWPFCCQRCRLAELGQWLQERYVISRRAEDVADDARAARDAPGGAGGASNGEANGA